MTEERIKVSDLIDVLREYNNCNVTVFEENGIMLYIDDDYISAEILNFNYQNSFIADETDVKEYINLLDWYDKMLMYSDITTNKLIELLEKHKNKWFYVCDECHVAVFEKDNSISIEYIS